MVSLLVFFRDQGLGVPSIVVFLYLFVEKEIAEGFLYFSRRSGAPLVIFDLPSSHKFWKERFFFVSGRNWEYDPLDKDDTLGVPVAWTTLENLRECRFVFGMIFMRSLIFLILHRPRVSQVLDPTSTLKITPLCRSWLSVPRAPYAELIKLDIPGPSSSRSARSAVLRSSPPSTMKVSPIGPSAAKPTKGELLAQLETLSRKPRSLKRKALDSAEKDRSASVKVSKLGASSSSPSTQVRMSEQALSPPVEVPKVSNLEIRSGSTAKAKSSSGKVVGQPLAVMPITVWNPPAQIVRPPSSRAEELKRKDSETGVDGDSLLLNAELAAGVVSSILKDSDLKKSSVLAVDEALAISF